MLSGRLVHVIEVNSDRILGSVVHEIRQIPELIHLRSLPDQELRDWGQHILENLGHWMAAGSEAEVIRNYEKLGRIRFEESIPLHEAVQALLLLKEKMIDFVQDQAIAKTSVQLYAEEELEHRVGRFFDVVVCSLVRGYENAMRRAAHVGA